MEETYKNVDEYAREGLRTLILAQKKINEQEYKQWLENFNEALNFVNNREEQVERVSA